MKKLTSSQQKFLDAVDAGQNVFLTGKAGTGKSYIVRKMMERALAAHKAVVAVAPTGIAATNIDGQTIHSMFRLNPYGVIGWEECQFMSSGGREVLKRMEIVVVDEISMLRPDILDGMHLTLKKNGLPGLDRRQVIFVGDMKQLPVILDDNTRSVLYRTYSGETFQDAHIYKKLNVQVIELDEMLRQTDEEFINNLNLVRDDLKAPYFRQFITTTPAGIILAPHNATVNAYNEKGLNSLQGKLYTFDAVLDGNAQARDFRLEQQVKVRNGSKIIYLVNSQDNPLRNGTLGIFTSYDGCHYIRVGNVDYKLRKVKQSKKGYVYNSSTDALELKEQGSITQYPIKLAYALSIHKAQGLTFDEMTLDLSRPCFQKGQLYVALSRVKGPEGLRIIR